MPHDLAAEHQPVSAAASRGPATAGSGTATDPTIPFRSTADERDRVVHHLRRRASLMLVGPTGCGKTTLVHEAAATLGLKVRTVIGHADLSVADLVGRWTLGANRSEWRDGPLTTAVRHGDLLYFDEIGGVPAEVLSCLHPLLDHRRELVVAARGETLQAHPDFALAASFNPGYGTTGYGLTPAFRQRFSWIGLDYLGRKAEIDLLCDSTAVDREHAEFLVAVAEVTRSRRNTGIDDGASTRLLLKAAAEIAAGIDRPRVLQECILGPLTDDPEEQRQLTQALGVAGVLAPPELAAIAPAPPRSLELTDEDFFDAQAAV